MRLSFIYSISVSLMSFLLCFSPHIHCAGFIVAHRALDKLRAESGEQKVMLMLGRERLAPEILVCIDL